MKFMTLIWPGWSNSLTKLFVICSRLDSCRDQIVLGRCKGEADSRDWRSKAGYIGHGKQRTHCSSEVPSYFLSNSLMHLHIFEKKKTGIYFRFGIFFVFYFITMYCKPIYFFEKNNILKIINLNTLSIQPLNENISTIMMVKHRY